MSGIFGLFNFNHKPVTQEIMQTMYDAMAFWGPDGGGIWNDGPVGLGQLNLYNTPEALFEKLPRKTDSGLVITAEARIDNRNELCDLFGIPQGERPQIPDSDLILRAYQKWGQDCTDHLLGDWSFAIWNPVEQRLFLARDHHGNTALYYYADDRVFAFASSRKALYALPQVPRRLNELYLGQLLISWPAYHGHNTIDLDVHRLPPSHFMTITPERLDIQRYWRLEDTPELRLSSFDEYLEGFLELYTEAVHCRLRSYRPVGATLSGGLDSGSVTALAARELKAQGKRLPTFTSVPIYDTSATVGPMRFGDETQFARAVAHFAGNVDPQFLRTEHISPMAGIRYTLEIHDEPCHAASNYFWIQDLLTTVHQQGIGTLLTGQGGNATISWTGLPELRSLWGAYHHAGWKKALIRILPGPLLRLYRKTRAGKISWGGSAIHPDFARRLGLAQLRADAAGRDITLPDTWRTPSDMRCAIIQPGRNFGGALWAENGASHSLEVRDPTTDKRLLEYALSIPDHIFDGPKGIDRWLIRQAMDNLLPDEVRLNHRRGRQSADLGGRLLNSVSEIELGLDELAASDQVNNYLDLEKMTAAWEDLSTAVTPITTHRAGSIFLRGMMAGLYLAGK